MTYDQLNMLLKKDIRATAFKPFKTLIDGGFNHLTPNAFEAFVLEIFETLNFSGSLTPASGDGGVDILLEAGTDLAVVQCKKYDDGAVIGSKELRELLGTIVHFKAIQGYFVTTSTFTNQAKEFSYEHSNMTLIDGECLKKLLFLSLIPSVRSNAVIYNLDATFLTQEFRRQVEGSYQAHVRDLGKEYLRQAEQLYQQFVNELENLKQRFR